ncbi:hypothetical protein ZWY2020_003354 [Hordeum vulgare]|nr:hypothetical protein ZWY2020_003354 [Hordeum vulgare]
MLFSSMLGPGMDMRSSNPSRCCVDGGTTHVAPRTARCHGSHVSTHVGGETDSLSNESSQRVAAFLIGGAVRPLPLTGLT